MSTIVNRFQSLGSHVKVNLGRLQIRMPEHFLDRPEACTRIQHMRCKGVPQAMGRDTDPRGHLLNIMCKYPSQAPG